ncbi:aminotransferase class I/II-fold pyridoxal phosphate-dependent enzyme [Spirosoma utsteinense]|uniref:7-keto-8-aminopelargonate synthetase-like enzyme n=1 Tax=Spirosoma utsteinense TaxID=2585773 RepID=A0ABR6W8U6_9BACT|nr:aminotransferase class I/II-fold pyridoxal phosphate-dependent enzyme [Spirosoma utsteinense]MBC3787306.1 7-keto-8-aminopelargonate synthetase-like enzyme [Spirosoma utsteinense]MBC3792991.1 7-keto-8-aminopelargonate synthetase-like enzyme [Spirosoma utsteinense]
MSDLFTIDQLPDRTITHDGNSYLFFSGTAYLGLQQNPVFQQALIDAIGHYGTSFGSSRNGNLRIGIYEEAEASLAALVGAPQALTLSSGMLAGQVVVNWLRAQNTTVVYGPQAHPALWDGPVVDLPTLPFTEWTAQLLKQLKQPNETGPVAILTNSVDAARSVYYSFDWVTELPDDRPITLVVDDSHGLGVLNNTSGIWPQIPRKSNVNLIVTGSLAKAMGLPGGVLLGGTSTVARLRETAFFGACSPMPPAYMHTFINAGTLYAEGRERLRQNLLLAEKLLIPTGLFSHATGYPIFFSEQDDLYTFLLERGIMIYSFSYPTPADRPNTRIIISAFHTFDDIQALAEAVYAYVFG